MSDCDCGKLHVEDLLKMNGSKTYLGLFAVTVGLLVQNFYNFGLGQQIVQGGLVFAGVGAAHKVEKVIKAIKQ